jgi:hypothetical protein
MSLLVAKNRKLAAAMRFTKCRSSSSAGVILRTVYARLSFEYEEIR